MKSSFSRLFVSLTVVLLAAMVLISIAFQVLTGQYFTNHTISSLKNDGSVIADLYRAFYLDQGLSSQDFYMTLTVATSVSGSDAVICDAQGNLLLCANSPMGCEHVGLRLDESYRNKVFASGGCSDVGVIEGLYTETRYMIFLPVLDDVTGAPLAIVLVSAPEDNTLTTISQISETFFQVGLLIVTICVVVLIFMVRRQSSPLKAMARAASAFGHGELSARVEISGHHSQEVEELALAFNNMASSLQKSEYQRQEFVANISHELKTPMTTISGYVDGILDGTIPPEKSRQYLSLVSGETKRLSRLVRSMLDISRLQDGAGVMPEDQKLRFDVTELAGQVLISFEQAINQKELEVEVDMPDHPVYTHANRDAINQVLYNLLDNGVKFCPQGGVLSVSVREGGGKVYLSVSNNGETIPAGELPLVFERFHKIDKSRSKNRDSWGLGLYIVKTIINSHGENISVTSAEGKTAFTFTLPLVL